MGWRMGENGGQPRPPVCKSCRMMEEWDIMERQKRIMDNQHMMRKYEKGQKQGNIRNNAAKCFNMLHEEMMKHMKDEEVCGNSLGDQVENQH